MQDWQLTVPRIAEHATQYHASQEVISSVNNRLHRSDWQTLFRRAEKLGAALSALGVRKGDVIGTLAWNTHQHLEVWYGIMNLGAICHTLNPRLFIEQIEYIVNHAEDSWIVADSEFAPILEKIEASCPTVKGFILLSVDEDNISHCNLKKALDYEQLLSTDYPPAEAVELQESDPAGLCYTSGTTGAPKGVMYTHRSNVLHAMTTVTPDMFNLGSRSVVMPVVPMYHANAWALTFAAPMAGSKIVLPGANTDGASLCQLINDEQVTITAGVPTVWLGLLQHLEKSGEQLPSLERIIIGGAAVPRYMIEKFENDYGITIDHAWGMTEMSPIGTICTPKAGMNGFSDDELMSVKLKQGRPSFGVEMKIVDDHGNPLPRDGTTSGNLMVRGPAIVDQYYKSKGDNNLDEEGYFTTGDVATIDAEGFMQITDRSKDIIKSGGEWISSIDIENTAAGHPDVEEAAVIAIPHEKWGERPLLLVTLKPGKSLDANGILQFLEGKIAKWWIPDTVQKIDNMPHTATGKIQKTTLRELITKT